VPALFAAQVARRPEATALEYGERSLSYSDLAQAAGAVAATLRAAAVEPGAFVGLCADRSPELIAGILGVLQAGCAYVPLDPSFPRVRMESILRDARAPVLLHTGLAEQDVPEFGGEPLDLLTALERNDDQPPSDPPAIGAEAPAYVMYTSGSTGAPKGVCIPHTGIVRLVCDTDYVDLGPDDRIAQASNPAFDASTFEIYGALLNGGCIVGIEREEMLSPPHLREILRQRRITTFFVTTALFNRLIDEEPAIFEPLRYVLLGGEAVDPRRVRAALLGGAPRHLLHVYGPTENTTFSTWYEVKDVAEDAHTVPIGGPIAHSTAHVLSPSLEPVAAGETGELYLGGPGVALGYLRQPKMTAECFIPDSFAGHGRLYATGDLVRRNADGAIEFIGRADGQIKLRGFRIEIGEIEAVLNKCPGVREAAVLVREDNPGRKQLVAYVAGPESLDSQALRESVAQRLPAFMVPASVVTLDQLPLNANGKIDRPALPAPPSAHARTVASGRTNTERRLTALWAGVLGMDEVGIDEGLFDLGATSLDVTSIVARLRSELGVEVPMRSLFMNPTVAELAHEIDGDTEGHLDLSEGLTRIDRARRLPLSSSQERVWILSKFDPDSRAYLFPSTLEFEGVLNIDALRATLSEIVRRHEIFRTTFPAGTDGRPYQWIHPPHAVDLPVIDVTGDTDAERRQALQLRLDAEFREPMNLTRLPLVRWKLFRLSEKTHVLSHVEQHILHDGWSFNIFMGELRKIYAAFAEGKPSPLPDLEFQFADYAAWQRRWMESKDAADQADYWKDQLADAPPLLDLPIDHPRPAVQSFEGSTLRVDLPPDLVCGLRRIAQAEKASLYSAIVTGFIAMFHRYSGQDDLCVSAPVATRGFPETESLLGMLINNVVLRSDLSGDPTVAEMLTRMKDVSFEAFANQELPLDRVVQVVNPPRNPSYNPLFQVGLGLHDSKVDIGAIPGIEMKASMALSNGSSKFDMAVAMLPYSAQWLDREFSDKEDGITAVVEYSTALFERSTIERMADTLMQLLRGMIADPQQHLSQLPLLGLEDQVKWNQTEHVFATAGHAHEEFTATAARTPNAVALRSGDRTMTYGELDERASRLALHLRSLGVAADTVVGVHADRSIEMVLGKLAIMKAGGAYLPLDPTYPEYRLSYMVDDSAAKFVVAQASCSSKRPALAIPVIELEDETSWTGTSSDPLPAVDSKNLAYIIYTSGSTGRPKGVAVEHRALSNLIDWHRCRYSVTSEDRASQVAAMGFDACVWELWPYLSCGASIDILPDDVRTSPADLWQWYRERGITLSFLPTPLAEAAMRHPVAEGMALRALLTGGDRLQHGVRDGQLPFDLVNHYGPTESAVVATAGDVGEQEPPHIGGPIDNVQAYVLDPHMLALPVGMVGELYVGGASLARGYLRHPGMTAELFVPHPFAEGQRLYRTGDLARWRADGTLDFLGRIDDQVKIRGFRIELGEIENELLDHPGVREAVVLARTDDGTEKRLVGYLRLRQKEHSIVDKIRDSLRARLPEYMVPTAFVVVDEMPLTRNGKIDRKALPAPEMSWEARADDYAAPRTEAETILAEIWQGFLRTGRIGIHDNFFELGGDSILGFQVAAAAREKGLYLTPQQMFQHHTVAEQAAVAGRRTVVDIDQGEISGEFPPQPTQAWWFAQEFADAHHFNQSQMLQLQRAIPEDVIRSAVAAVMQHHDALRSRFPGTGRNRRVVIEASGGDVPFQTIDLSATDASERRVAIEKVMTELQQSLDLERGPVFRVAAIELGGGEPGLVALIAHHLVVDGLSWRVMIEDLATACGQGLRNEAVKLPDKTTSVGAWAGRLANDLAGSDDLRSELDYWVAQHAGGHPLPRDHDVGDDANIESSTVLLWRELDRDQTRTLLQNATAAYDRDVTEIILTALLRSLQLWSGRRDQAVLMEGHGREPLFDDIDVSRTMGWFTAMYPLHLELPDVWQAEQSVTAISEQLSQAPNRGVGYGVLTQLDDAENSQRLHAEPAPELSFNYMGQLDQSLSSSDLFAWSDAPEGPRRSPRARRPQLLDFVAEVRNGVMRLGCSYAATAHDQRTIDSLLDNWVAALAELVAAAQARAGGLATTQALSRGDLDDQDLERLIEDLD